MTAKLSCRGESHSSFLVSAAETKIVARGDTVETIVARLEMNAPVSSNQAQPRSYSSGSGNIASATPACRFSATG
ncbi:hypothetical protein C5C51_09510 [Rathayibacter toxicus]|uniref:Uncharacterized protein n=1 Tax=Rathayibacter toxicus TaxID=145458 RepID=A0A2S5Y5B2_9MICO|nr:hypothetical protein C5C51_09510 [Rathayibacter toxicus]